MTLLEQLEAAREDVQTCCENEQQAILALNQAERKTQKACERLEALLACNKLTVIDFKTGENKEAQP